MHSEEKLKEFVKAGVEWLDNSYPGWYNKIDLTNFQFKYSDSCVIGQLNLWGKVGRSSELAYNLGFDIDIDVCDCTLQENSKTTKILHNEWLKQIKLKLAIPVKSITLNLTYQELVGRFPEKMKTVLEAMTFQLDEKQAEEWGITSYEFQGRLK